MPPEASRAASAIEKCPQCGGPVIFAIAGRARVAYDAAPIVVGVPRYGEDLARTFSGMRVVDVKRAHRPHSESCTVAIGRAARMAGENDD